MRNITINLEHGQVTVTISRQDNGAVVMTDISRPLTADEMRRLADAIDLSHDEIGWNPEALSPAVLVEWHNV